MRSRKTAVVSALASLLLALGIALPAVHAADAKLGKVNFPTSCNPAAQKEFEVAMAYYHSFAWPELKAALDRVTQADPACGMAYWGRALGLLDNPFQWPGSLTPKILADGQAAIDAARAAGLKTQRERDYVEALAVFFKDADKVDHRTRATAFETAMQGVAARNAADTEATILYALVLSANFDPTDKKYMNQLRATKLMKEITPELLTSEEDLQERIRNHPAVTLQPCNLRGKVTDDAEVVNATADVLLGADARPVSKAVRRKYRVAILLLDVGTLPVAGLESARKALDPSLPSNALISRADRIK